MSNSNKQQPPVGVPPLQGYPPEGYPNGSYSPAGYPPQDHPAACNFIPYSLDTSPYPSPNGQPQRPQQSSCNGFMDRCLAILCCCCLDCF